MANGFKALRHVGGGVQRLSELPILAATPAIFNGDAVTITDGALIRSTAAAAAVAGSFLGCMYVTAKGEQKFSPDWVADTAATEIFGLFNDDKNVSYTVQGAAALAVGAGCDLVSGSGNTLLGTSGDTVAAGTAADFTVKSVLDATNFVFEVTVK